MTAAHRRHDMTDEVWERLRPHLPSGESKRGRPAHDNRRFCRSRDRGEWARMLEAVMDDPDFEWLMIDASYIKAHPHSAGAQGGNQAIARTKGGSTASCTPAYAGAGSGGGLPRNAGKAGGDRGYGCRLLPGFVSD